MCLQSLSTCTEYKSFRTGASWCFIITVEWRCRRRGRMETYLVDYAIGALTEENSGVSKGKTDSKERS